MKKRLLSLIIVGALSIGILYGCGDKATVQDNTPSQDQSQNDADKDISGEDNNDDTSDESLNKNLEEKITEKFTEAISTIYNTDFTSEDDVKTVTDYINNNFTEDSKEDMINIIKNYSSKISSSDLVITLVKAVDNIDDSKYTATYDVRYNVVITEEKPSHYIELMGKVVIDKSDNILINSINEGNF